MEHQNGQSGSLHYNLFPTRSRLITFRKQVQSFGDSINTNSKAISCMERKFPDYLTKLIVKYQIYLHSGTDLKLALTGIWKNRDSGGRKQLLQSAALADKKGGGRSRAAALCAGAGNSKDLARQSCQRKRGTCPAIVPLIR